MKCTDGGSCGPLTYFTRSVYRFFLSLSVNLNILNLNVCVCISFRFVWKAFIPNNALIRVNLWTVSISVTFGCMKVDDSEMQFERACVCALCMHAIVCSLFTIFKYIFVVFFFLSFCSGFIFFRSLFQSLDSRLPFSFLFALSIFFHYRIFLTFVVFSLFFSFSLHT